MTLKSTRPPSKMLLSAHFQSVCFQFHYLRKKQKNCVFFTAKYSVMITSADRGKRGRQTGETGGEKSASGMEDSQEGKKNSSTGGKESINTGNYSQTESCVICRLGTNTKGKRLNTHTHTRFTFAWCYAPCLGDTSLESSAVFHSAQYCMSLC